MRNLEWIIDNYFSEPTQCAAQRLLGMMDSSTWNKRVLDERIRFLLPRSKQEWLSSIKAIFDRGRTFRCNLLLTPTLY